MWHFVFWDASSILAGPVATFAGTEDVLPKYPVCNLGIFEISMDCFGEKTRAD